MSLRALFFIIIFTYALPSLGNDKGELILLLKQAKNECNSGKIEQGIDHTIDVGIKSRMSKVKLSWRNTLDNCYLKWMKQTVRQCKNFNINSIVNLKKIINKAKYSGSPKVKKYLKQYLNKCIIQANKRIKNSCNKSANILLQSIDFIKTFQRNINIKKFNLQNRIKRFNKDIKKCSKKSWKNTIKQCLTNPGIETLTLVDSMKSNLFKNSYGNEEYRTCIVSILNKARALCKNGNTDLGLKLLEKARKRLLILKPKDEVLIKKTKEWAPECGIVKLKMKVVMEAKARGYSFVINGFGNFTIRRVKGNEVQACGDFKTMDFKTRDSKGCTVRIIIERENKGLPKSVIPRRICLTGKIFNLKGVGRKLDLYFDTMVARTMFKETFQIQCPNKPSIIYKEHLLEDLISTKRIFRVKGMLEPGTKIKNYFFKNFGKNKRVEWKSEWKIVPLNSF